METYLQWSKQGLSALGTHSSDEASAMWQRHLDTNVAAELRDSVALSPEDWDAATRMWTLPPDDTLLTAQPSDDAMPALLLRGLPDVYSAVGA
jgi:hypothetical protein